jgi:hypothetical protein
VKKKPLQVSLHAREPSVVELTVGDRVQLDRLTPSPHGYAAERHGRLLDPGVTTVALPPGHYFFKTLSDANLRVVTGGVAAGIAADSKDPWPQPPPLALPAPNAAGDEMPGELPSLTIE